ncbi:peptidase_S9 domain-containing protein [Pseudoscourfieldia marina]
MASAVSLGSLLRSSGCFSQTYRHSRHTLLALQGAPAHLDHTTFGRGGGATPVISWHAWGADDTYEYAQVPSTAEPPLLVRRRTDRETQNDKDDDVQLVLDTRSLISDTNRGFAAAGVHVASVRVSHDHARVAACVGVPASDATEDARTVDGTLHGTTGYVLDVETQRLLATIKGASAVEFTPGDGVVAAVASTPGGVADRVIFRDVATVAQLHASNDAGVDKTILQTGMLDELATVGTSRDGQLVWAALQSRGGTRAMRICAPSRNAANLDAWQNVTSEHGKNAHICAVEHHGAMGAIALHRDVDGFDTVVVGLTTHAGLRAWLTTEHPLGSRKGGALVLRNAVSIEHLVVADQAAVVFGRTAPHGASAVWVVSLPPKCDGEGKAGSLSVECAYDGALVLQPDVNASLAPPSQPYVDAVLVDDVDPVTPCTLRIHLPHGECSRIAHGDTEKASRLKTSRLLAPSDHGSTHVPITLVEKESSIPPRAVLCYVYGSYGHATTVTDVAPWLALLDADDSPAIDAIALFHIRGGGELGGCWHRAGAAPEGVARRHDDVLAAASHLRDRVGPTSTLHLSARSAGAIAAANAIAASPGTFASACLTAPFLDATEALSSAAPGSATAHFAALESAEFGHTADDAAIFCPTSRLQGAIIIGDEQPAVALLVAGADGVRAPLAGATRWLERWQQAIGTTSRAYLHVSDRVGHFDLDEDTAALEWAFHAAHAASNTEKK